MRTGVRAVGYVRLSREDEGKLQESESIQNQKALIGDYARRMGWALGHIYSDEDFSGTDSRRPAFRRLLADAESGEFDIVICKSQSRFTRDMEAVERYIHTAFPLWGIRFVTITDNADTDVKGNKKARQINGLINEWYLEDLSENIRLVLDHKRKAGQFIGAFPVYGYRKDPADHNRLVPDPAAAETVRKIYALYLQGLGKTRIAEWLNEQGVPGPAAYRRGQRGAGCAGNAAAGGWSRTAVGRILRDRTYIGDLVQGKKKKPSYKSGRLVAVPEEDWIVVPRTHEAIVDRTTFAAVQQARGQRARPATGGEAQAHPLSGKVRCMDCGAAMHKYQMRYRGNTRHYLRCGGYSAHRGCGSGHGIRLDRLEMELAGLLRTHIAAHCSVASVETNLRHDGAAQSGEAARLEARRLRLDVERRQSALRTLYLDRAEGVLSAGQFRAFSDAYRREIRQLEHRAAALERDADRARSAHRPQLREQLEAWARVERLDRALVLCFIDHVEIGERDRETGQQAIRVHWLF